MSTFVYVDRISEVKERVKQSVRGYLGQSTDVIEDEEVIQSLFDTAVREYLFSDYDGRPLQNVLYGLGLQGYEVIETAKLIYGWINRWLYPAIAKHRQQKKSFITFWFNPGDLFYLKVIEPPCASPHSMHPAPNVLP